MPERNCLALDRHDAVSRVLFALVLGARRAGRRHQWAPARVTR
jgi:hypothetical protein